MKNEIKEKLKPFLSTPVKKECTVVYILAEIRKLLEQMDNKSNFLILEFYCSWVLHAKMNDPILLKKIEEEKKESGKTIEVVMEEFVSLSKLRRELIQFLSQQNLGNRFEEDKYWEEFKSKMRSIISECPLMPNDSYSGPIKKICYQKNFKYENINYGVQISEVWS